MRTRFVPAFLLCLVAVPWSAAAQPASPADDKPSQTQHAIRVDGHELKYTATAGTLPIRGEDGKVAARMFYVAYTRDGEDPKTRPVSFLYNGGPGSATVWLHMGSFAPRRVQMADDGFQPAPPYHLVDNENTLLDVTDLVFIDAISTGYSRAVAGVNAAQFHGQSGDLHAFGDFINEYLKANSRWPSPKFLIGESYGTTRGTGVAAYMQDRYGLYLNGLMLVSCALDFGQLEFERGNDTPYIGFLPTYAATAWYHGRLAPDLQADLRATVAEVEEFAVTDYAVALARGAKLADADRSRIIAQLARYTGLTEDYIDRADLRISDQRFFKELLRSERRTVGRIDSRFLGIDRDAAGETPEDDPSIGPVYAPFAATLNDYVRGSLEFETDRAYEVLHPTLWKDWSYAEHENRYVDVGETLRKTMTANPSLKVNITTRYYEAGHMMYIHEPSLAALKADLAAFLDAAIPAP
jgi:carboxypeptidase C (cathepsin A)